jgi:hypothetical protein
VVDPDTPSVLRVSAFPVPRLQIISGRKN